MRTRAVLFFLSLLWLPLDLHANPKKVVRKITTTTTTTYSPTRTYLGLRMTELDKGSVYERAGLRVGDIVKTVNGKPIRRAEDLQDVPHILKRDRRIEIRIIRAGRHIVMRYRIETRLVKK